MRQRHLESIWSQQVPGDSPLPQKECAGCSGEAALLHRDACGWDTGCTILLGSSGCGVAKCKAVHGSHAPATHPRAVLICLGCQAFQKPITRVLTSGKLGKSLFPTETGQNLQLLQCPDTADVKAHAKCWMLAQRGRDGERRDNCSFFSTLFINKAPVCECTSGPAVAGTGGCAMLGGCASSYPQAGLFWFNVARSNPTQLL